MNNYSNKKLKADMTMLLNLPQDIIIEILLRVPVEYLITLKRVCKFLFKLISDRYFASAHLDSHHEEDIFIEIMCVKPHIHGYSSIKLQEFKDMELKEVKMYSKGGVSLRASCDGLMLLENKRDGKQLYICNPITCNCTTLPRLETQDEVRDWVVVLDDSIDHKYKVVGMSVDFHKCFVFKPEKTTSQWTVLHTPFEESLVLSTQFPPLVNKEFHWLRSTRCVTGSKENYEPCIYSVNAAKVAFRETKVSPMINCRYNHNSILEVKGSLCLTDDTSPKQLDIWVLRYKENHNCQWTKSYNIILESELHHPIHVYSFPPSNYLGRTIILVHHKNQLLFYDLENKDSKIIDIEVDEGRPFTKCPFVHINSLVDWE
ncbi:hypothetical protein IFM89_037824 [Coptis chinensis]|uniref:F-box domain-containing protein n=1 Tax=Coptis chinensis TaxID=261450 RepID=A0A835HT03_9MAGN|nr:hypothetical protein IFM89_037824 [Coptis chinensis]